jgi:hypothetical protein
MKTRARDAVFQRDKGIRFMFTYVDRSCVSFGRSYTAVNQRAGDLRRRKSLRALAKV